MHTFGLVVNWSVLCAVALYACLSLARLVHRGTRRERGSRRPSAFTSTRARGMTTPATGTAAECSSSLARGIALAHLTPRQLALLREVLSESSYTAPTSCGSVTADRGASGGRQARADYGES